MHYAGYKSMGYKYGDQTTALTVLLSMFGDNSSFPWHRHFSTCRCPQNNM